MKAPRPALAIPGGLTQLPCQPVGGQDGAALDDIVDDASQEDLFVAARHLEDLEIFVGQRSRMHPGPGWDVVLGILRRDLGSIRAILRERDPAAETRG